MLYGFKMDQLAEYIKGRETSLGYARNNLGVRALETAQYGYTFDASDLTSAVQGIAEIEAELQVVKYVKRYLDRHPDVPHEKIWNELVESFILQGADDTWSGRNNDTRRVIFDAKRRVVQDLKFHMVKSD